MGPIVDQEADRAALDALRATWPCPLTCNASCPRCGPVSEARRDARRYLARVCNTPAKVEWLIEALAPITRGLEDTLNYARRGGLCQNCGASGERQITDAPHYEDCEPDCISPHAGYACANCGQVKP